MSRWHTHLTVIVFMMIFAPPVSGGMQADGQGAPTPAAAEPFGFEDVFQRAQQLTEQPYEPDRPELPQVFSEMQYDQYRDIRFRPEANLWAAEALPFQLQFFSRGFLYADRVSINVIDDGAPRQVPFSREQFDFGKNRMPPDLPEDMGFAGFRILYPLHREDHLDEIAAFLGASYFRAIGQHQNYGISARALAINTGLDAPEEFPVFREFWVQKPGAEDTELTIFALLDSQSAAGAYRFIIKPGLQTVIDVRARVLMRNAVDKLGIAPLTSMFYHGEVTNRFVDDFRPEVHDSDGLLVESGRGERIWRPVVNPERLQITPLEVTNPRGFGLMQRDRDYDHYQDTEAVYHTRPSAWVEALSMWGQGQVELVEIPSLSERNDNLVAYWTPAEPPEGGETIDVEYRLHFAVDPEAQLRGGRAISTRIGAGGADEPDYSRRKFVIDFVGPTLLDLDPEAPNVEPVCNTSSGEIAVSVAHHNRFTDGWRLFFELIPEEGQAADLRCFLRRGEDVLSETWVFRWVPN